MWQYLWQKLFLKHYENKMVFHLVYLITLKILFVLFCKNISNIYTCMYNKHEKNSFLYLYFHNRVWSSHFLFPSMFKIENRWSNFVTPTSILKYYTPAKQSLEICYDVCIFRNNNIWMPTFQYRVTLQTYSDLVWHPAFLFAGGLVQPGPSFLSLPVQNDTNGTRMAPTLSKSRNETRVFSWTEFCSHLIGQNNLESINVQEYILCQNANCHVRSAVLH